MTIDQWLSSQGLPRTGWVLLLGRRPFGWERRMPIAASVVPGVVAIQVETGERMVATGGDRQGAKGWTVLNTEGE